MAILEVDDFVSRYPDDIPTLLEMLRTRTSGGVAVVGCDDTNLRTRLLDYLRRRLEADGVYLFSYEVSDKDTNLVRRLSELTQQPRFKNLEISGQYRAIVLFVYGVEKFNTEERGKFIRLLNFLRERLLMVGRPVVLWGSSTFVAELARLAPDFWNHKDHYFSFAARRRPPADTADLYANLPPIRRYLRRLVEDRDYAIWKDLYLPLKAKRTADLSELSLRHTLTYEELRQIAPLFPTTESFSENDFVFHQGEPGHKCYIIVSGEVEVTVTNALGEPVIINRLSKGDFFGEIGVLKKTPRTATVRTTQPAKFVTFTHEALPMLNTRAPAVLDILTEIAQRRLERRNLGTDEMVSPLRRFALEGANLIRQASLDVRELIANDHRSIILGEAGAGKTTVLRRLALETAEQSEDLLESNEVIVMPVFLRLNALVPQKTVESLILDLFHNYSIPEYQTEADVRALLNGDAEHAIHSCLFLLDGLNEMPHPAQTRPELNRFLRQYAQHRFVVSCRTDDYIALRGFRTALLQRLGDADIEAFLVNYLRAEKGRRVAREIYSDPQLEDLAQSPLALSMLAQIARRSHEALPKNRGALFEAFTNELLERSDSEWWQLLGPTDFQVPLDLRRRVLARLGLTMHETEAWTFAADKWLALIHEVLEAYYKDHDDVASVKSETIDEEIKLSGLIRFSRNPDRVEFTHQTYQEFFAALAQRDSDHNLEPILQDPDLRRHWQGPIILLYGIAHDTASLYATILGDDNNYARIWLGAQCLTNSDEDLAIALNRLERLLSLQQHFALLFSVGLASRQLGRYPEALSYLHMALEESPGSAEVQFELGSLYRQVEQYERTITHLEQAIRLRSDFVDAYNQLGLAYHDQQKYVEALTVFKAATQLEPHNPYHFYNLGALQKTLRAYIPARESFRTALALKDDYSEAKAQLDILEKALTTGVVQVLDKIPLLSKLSLEQSVLLANRIRVVEYQAGQIVFHMGELGDTFYIVEAGKVELLTRDGTIQRLGPGDVFGEIALLRSLPRTSTTRVLNDTRLLAISRADFETILTRYPAISHDLAETSSLRLVHERPLGRRIQPGRFYDPGYIAELTQQSEVTVLMGDIHGSTFLTSAIGPELMVAFLDEYLLRMSTLIVKAGGALDKSLGDSVMGVFGNTPGGHTEDSVRAALLAAFEMRQAYFTLREEWQRAHIEFSQTGMGIGISTGKVKTGTVGPDATMVGPAVNLTSKLSKLAIKGRTESEIYVDGRTHQLVGDGFDTELLDMDYTRRKVGVDLEAYRVIQRR